VGEAGDERAGLSYHSLKQSLKNFWGTNC
jgi:hypothetical protein